MAVRAVFLDKDGTLIRDVPYNTDPSKIVLFEDTVNSLRRMQSAGYRLVLATNQSGVARGYFSLDELRRTIHALIDQLRQHGVQLADTMICPHHPQGQVERFRRTCLCRKPQPGMLLAAAERHGIDLKQSWMIGDILDDIEAGNRAGCRSIHVDNGGETVWQMGAMRTPFQAVGSLTEAADIILGLEGTDNHRPPIDYAGIQERSRYEQSTA